MRRKMMWFGLLMIAAAGVVRAETYAFMPAAYKHKLKMVRKYQMIVIPSKTNVAEFPAMFGFTGATNEQTIDSSVFTFTIPPDEVSVVSHDLGMPRKMYRMVWKNPTAITMEVKQEMVITLSARNKLCTEAKLPYSEDVKKKYADYLNKSKDGDINPEIPALDKICKEILSQNVYAEQIVSAVCDWVADNFEWRKGENVSTDKTLANHGGNSYDLSSVACSILRKAGIPCDVVYGTYVGGSSYYYIEAYFPDAGWVFYDIACSTRGFMTLDCMATVGYAFRVNNEASNDPNQDKSGQKFEWQKEKLFDSWDLGKVVEPEPVLKKALRRTPTKGDALSVMVMHVPVPAGLPVRQEPIRAMTLDAKTPVLPMVEKKAQDGSFESDRPKDTVRQGKE